MPLIPIPGNLVQPRFLTPEKFQGIRRIGPASGIQPE
jgi:hypothetical protein